MRNGQLKPAYNVQNAVDSGYVVCCTVGSGRTDYHTAAGMLEKLARSFPWRYRTYCAAHGIEALIKPQHWEQAKGRAFRADPSRVENMAYDGSEDAFTCMAGRKLRFTSERRRRRPDRESVREYACRYGCKSCPLRGKCLDRKADRKTGFKHVSVMLGHMRARLEAGRRLATREGAEASVCTTAGPLWRNRHPRGRGGKAEPHHPGGRLLCRGEAEPRPEALPLRRDGTGADRMDHPGNGAGRRALHLPLGAGRGRQAVLGRHRVARPRHLPQKTPAACRPPPRPGFLSSSSLGNPLSAIPEGLSGPLFLKRSFQSLVRT